MGTTRDSKWTSDGEHFIRGFALDTKILFLNYVSSWKVRYSIGNNRVVEVIRKSSNYTEQFVLASTTTYLLAAIPMELTSAIFRGQEHIEKVTVSVYSCFSIQLRSTAPNVYFFHNEISMLRVVSFTQTISAAI